VRRAPCGATTGLAAAPGGQSPVLGGASPRRWRPWLASVLVGRQSARVKFKPRGRQMPPGEINSSLRRTERAQTSLVCTTNQQQPVGAVECPPTSQRMNSRASLTSLPPVEAHFESPSAAPSQAKLSLNPSEYYSFSLPLSARPLAPPLAPPNS